jgi:endonuclease VIII
MPEGDSIYRVATALRPLLLGTPLVRVHVGGVIREELTGATATAVTPLGKHMMIELDRGWELRIHLGMNGRWRRYRSPRPAPLSATLILVTATDEIACLNAPTVELTARRDARRSRAIASLGPDILADDFDLAAVVARARLAGATPIGVVILDQRVSAGMGNVYKSEALWLEQQSPFTPTSELSDAKIAALFTAARQLMLQNLGPGRRVTRLGRLDAAGRVTGSVPRAAGSPDERYWAYNRSRRPCSRCGTLLTSALQGQQLRRTYYCPRCQPGEPPPAAGRR